MPKYTDPGPSSQVGRHAPDGANIPGTDFELIKGMGHYLSALLIDTLVDVIVKNAAKAK